VNALGCTFKLCRSDEDFAICYENALKNPTMATLEHFHLELFSCYGRLLQPKKMHQIAQKLYKQFDQPKFIFWIVSSMVLQSDLPRAILAVAEKLLRKVFYELYPTKQPGAEELHLFITVLVLEGKFADGIVAMNDLLSRPVRNDEKLQDEEHFQGNSNMVAVQQLSSRLMLLDLYWQSQLFAEAKKQVLLVLDEFPDQWNAYMFLTAIVLSAAAVPPSSMAMQPQCALSDLVCFDDLRNWNFPTTISTERDSVHLSYLRDYLRYVTDKKTQNYKLRGPYLAIIHTFLELQVSSAENSVPYLTVGELHMEEVLTTKDFAILSWIESYLISANIDLPEERDLCGVLLKLFIEYLSVFQSKYCCYMDLKPFIFKLSLLKPATIANIVWTGIAQWISQELQINQYDKLCAKLEKSKNNGNEVNEIITETKLGDGDNETEAKIPLEENDDGENDDEDEGESKDAKGKAKKKKNNKKRNKKNKKPASLQNTNDNSSTMTEKKSDVVTTRRIDAEHLQSLTGKDEDLLVMICCYSQLDSIRSFIDQLLASPLCKDKILNRYDLFDRTHEIFRNGIAGESRTVQPADDLQLINSSFHRVEMKMMYPNWLKSLSSKQLDQIGETMPMISLVTQWCSTLSNAINASKYSFPLKVDYMETSKILLNAPAVLHAFDNLGVKYIQNDTLSYLLVPSLLEGGLYIESIKQYRTILHYYKIGRRETLDMLSKAFEYANYDKVFDLVKFVEESDKSLQLAVTKAELPLLEIVQKRVKVSEVTNYLHDLFEAKLPESQSYFSEEMISGLVSHLDLQILARLDGFPEQTIGFVEEKNLRVLQIVHRIRHAQELLKFSNGFFANDLIVMKQSREILNQITTEASFGKLESSNSSYISFDQNIEGSKSFATVHHQAFLRLVDYFILVESRHAEVSTDEQTLFLFSNVHTAFSQLSGYFTFQTRMPAGFAGGRSVVHPEFIRRVSALQRLSATWGALFFIHSLPSVLKLSEDVARRMKETILNVVNGESMPSIEESVVKFPIENPSSEEKTAIFYWNMLLMWFILTVTVRKTLVKLVADYETLDARSIESQPLHHLIFQQDVYMERLRTTNEVIAQAHNFSLQRLEGLLDARINSVLDTLKELLE